MFFLAISTRTRSAEPNMERGSARVRVCKKQEEKARREAAFVFSCDINENPFGGAEHGARQREGSSLPKARRKKRDAKRHLY